MPRAREALSANMAALSYAMDLAQDTEGFNVNVKSGARPGPLERRRQSAEIASPEDMSLELERGKPLKNFGRTLAHSAGIPLPYNFRQAGEAAEQARIDYENESEAFRDLADTFASNMEENALFSADASEERIYNQYAAQGADAVSAFYAQDASPQQRAAAAQRLAQLDGEARLVRNSDSNERTKFVRQYLGGELASSRAGLVQMDMAEKDRVTSFESELAQLDNAQLGSAEEQIMLRAMLATGVQRSQNGLATLTQAGGSALSLAGHPAAVAAGAAMSIAGAVLANETAKLDRDDVVRMRLEMNDTMNAMTAEFRPEVVRLHEQVVGEAGKYGIPGSSWSTEHITLETPYADAARSRLFGDSGESSAPGGDEPDREQAYSAARRYEQMAERARRRETR